ncbi:hypothetical protein D1B31_15505 [Neobacillus notoginsengisoli]|uniref:Uncharacterized protein n=1 Tax=Neobacillus notoginsengisoli TaxID=1578198 RepID=A0A417YS88_9BACI|nr:hypothetical protein [Neobacillus notoginsengisoli]RHW38174.1 hypothetical protein D1B31_15505 [Neobacillus notoginsengisoli]
MSIDNQYSNESDRSKEEINNQDMKNHNNEIIHKGEISEEVIVAEQLKRYHQQLQTALQPAFQAVAKMQGRMQDVAQSINLISEGMQKTLQPLYRRIGDVRQSIIKVLESIDFKKIHEAAKALEENTIRFKAIMIELGLPPHDSIPTYHISYIVRFYDEKGIDYTKRLISRYMSLMLYDKKALWNMQKAWQKAKWLENRIKILDSVIEGHLKGYYDLTIPTLLAQIEGILVEGILTLDETDDKIGYRIQKNFLAQVILGDTNTFSFDIAIERIYTTIILAEFERGKEVNSELSRHAILHGEDVKYGTKMNSLKAILIFDYLFNKLDELYHDIEKSKQEIRKRRRGMKKSHNSRYGNKTSNGRIRNLKHKSKDKIK